MRIALITLVIAFMSTSGWAQNTTLLNSAISKIDKLKADSANETFQSNAVSDAQKAFINKKISSGDLKKNVINDDAKFASWFKANFQDFLSNYENNQNVQTGISGNKDQLKSEIKALRDQKKQARKTWEDAKDSINAQIKAKQAELRKIDPKSPEAQPETTGNDQLLQSGDPLPNPTITLQ